jgi:hypothetical protein
MLVSPDEMLAFSFGDPYETEALGYNQDVLFFLTIVAEIVGNSSGTARSWVLSFLNRERRLRRQIFIHLIGNVQHELQIPVNKDVGI